MRPVRRRRDWRRNRELPERREPRMTRSGLLGGENLHIHACFNTNIQMVQT